MRLKAKVSLVVMALTLALSGHSVAADEQFSAEQKTEVISKLAKALTEKYVLVEEGKAFGEKLIELDRNGAFETNNNQRAFTFALHQRLSEISNDKHIAVIPAKGFGGGQRMMQMSGQHIETSILAGNIGLLTINDLMGTPAEINQAMLKLASTDGLLIDMRQCPGGDENIVAQVMSYFIPENETIIEMHQRDQDVRLVKSRQLPEENQRYLNKPITAVTSNYTGSGCEEIAFDIKYHDLGYIYGENTAGAGFALQSEAAEIGYGIKVNIPDTAPKHPKYNFTFEKVGVSPDLRESAHLALDKAHQMMLSQLLVNADNAETLKNVLITSIEKTNEISLRAIELSREYRDYLGDYGVQDQIIQGNGQLQVVIKGNRTFGLNKIDKDLFAMKMTRGGKIRFERDHHGNITGYSLYRPHTAKWTFVKRKV